MIFKLDSNELYSELNGGGGDFSRKFLPSPLLLHEKFLECIFAEVFNDIIASEKTL